MRLKLFWGIGFLFLVSSSAFGWNSTGHMLIADIALKHLRKNVKEVCESLLQNMPAKEANTFIDCAPWADDVRTRKTASWHYIDLYFSADGTPNNLQPRHKNVVWAIKKFTEQLKNKSLPTTMRANALRYLIHFVGDIHQPLHCCSRITRQLPYGDKGGNDFFFSHPSANNPRPHELHYLWDEGGGLFKYMQRPIDQNSRNFLDYLARRAMRTLTSSEIQHELKITRPLDWAKEGQAIAQKFVYATPEYHEPSSNYILLVQHISLQRCAIAGLRLAHLLNQIIK